MHRFLSTFASLQSDNQEVMPLVSKICHVTSNGSAKIAFSEGAVFVDGHVLELRTQGWRPNFTALLTTQPGDPSVFQRLDVTDIIERQKEAYLSAFINNEALSTLVCTEVCSLSTDMRIIYLLFRVSLIGDLSVGSDVVVMVCNACRYWPFCQHPSG